MEETKSGTRSGITECMDDGGYEKPNPSPEVGRVVWQFYLSVASARKIVPVVVDSIMEALRDPNIHTIGMCSKEGGGAGSSLSLPIEKRVERDKLFDLIVKCNLSVSNLTEIQKGIARELGFSIPNDEKSSGCMVFRRRNKQKKVVTRNAKLLSERIRAQPNILFILYDLGTTLDLAKLGIPIGVDHKGCKLILTTEKEEILSKMNVQRSYSV